MLLSSPPPPGPPPLLDLDPMIAGLDGDDVYMMVEDEFYATAQTFTAHLHRAEYKRLMREAREKKRRGLAPAVPGILDDAARAVRDKLTRQALDERQGSGVKALMGGLLSSDREDEGELEREEEKVNDPWAGTSLAPLMRYDSNERVSLKGLERISGATRAAQGFGPSRGRVSTGVEGGEGEDENGNGSRRENGTHVTGGDASSDLEEGARAMYEVRGSSSANINGSEAARAKSSSMEQKRQESKELPPAPARSKLAREHHRIPEPKLVKKQNMASENDNKSKHGLTNKPTKAAPAKKKYKSFIDSLDDFDQDTFEQAQTQTQTQARSSQRPALASAAHEKPQPRIKHEDKGKDKDKKDRSSRYDEIPIFLA